MSWFNDRLFDLALRLSGGRAYHALHRAARNPQAAQQRALQRILRLQSTTAFGRAHGFAGLSDIEAFRRRVPLATYEDLEPYIARQIAGERALTSEKPVLYARTSGTLAAPKLIPVTPTALKRTRAVQSAMAWACRQACDLYAGRILLLSGATREDSLPDGTPIGSATGLIYDTLPASIRKKYVVPSEVFSINDATLKYAIVAHLALKTENLTAVSSANPSTFLRLRDYVQAHWQEMITDIRRGRIDGLDTLDTATRQAVKRAIAPDPKRADQLELYSARDTTTIGDLWPHLAGVVTWTGGSCAIAAQAVRRALPAHTRLIEAGYVASEMRGTVVLDAHTNLALPVLEDVVFEFLPVADWDAGQRDTLLLHQIQPDQDYQIVVTTLNGLYRYVMNDILRTGPKIANTHSLRFVQKGKGFTNITGEKLSEQQVNAAMLDLHAVAGGEVRFFVVLADEEAARYDAYTHIHPATDQAAVDPTAMAAALDACLCTLNIEYAAKRATGRLHPLRLYPLRPETALAYRDAHIALGQREAQFKVLTLQYRRDCRFDFAPYMEQPDAD